MLSLNGGFIKTLFFFSPIESLVLGGDLLFLPSLPLFCLGGVRVWNKVLDLLGLEHDSLLKLIELGHFLALEVLDLLLGLSEVGLDTSFSILQPSPLLIHLLDSLPDCLSLIKQLHSLVL